jgi:hypothetical protein
VEDVESPPADNLENDNNIDNALGIGSHATISKNELFSLIRFGTNAIIDNYDALTDRELDKFLETQGRDMPGEADALPCEAIASAGDSNDLKEVDLRQLGDTLFIKKKSSNKLIGSVTEKNIVSCDSDNALPAKRVRVERIVYVDGKGSGYGGDIPTLKANLHLLDDNQPVASVPKSKLRRKNWINQEFCCICGLVCTGEGSSNTEGGAIFQCGYCPKVYHWNCLDQTGVLNGYNMHITFSCPHHRCSVCSRTTATAGGMLFRCYDCLAAFCEDCLEHLLSRFEVSYINLSCHIFLAPSQFLMSSPSETLSS